MVSIGIIIYYVVAYVIMLFVSALLVGTMHKPSIYTKIAGVLLFLFAPITLPLFIITFIAINVLS